MASEEAGGFFALLPLWGESNERGISRGSRLGLVGLEPKKQCVPVGITLGLALLLSLLKEGKKNGCWEAGKNYISVLWVRLFL